MKFIPIVLIAAFCFLSGCRKDEEPDYSSVFREEVQGEWDVREIYWGDSNWYYNILYYYFPSTDSIKYFPRGGGSILYFNINDSSICDLPYIDNLERWNIFELDGQLKIEVDKVCGDRDTFKFYYSNVEYYNGIFSDEFSLGVEVSFDDIQMEEFAFISTYGGAHKAISVKLKASNTVITRILYPIWESR